LFKQLKPFVQNISGFINRKGLYQERKTVVKRNLFILIILFICLIIYHLPSWAGQGIVSVQSIRIQPYEKAINGFESVCHARIKRLVLSEMKDVDVVDKINEITPSIVLAIGPEALKKVRPIQDIPVIYFMVLNPLSLLSGEKNVHGIGMTLPPETQLRALRDAMPGARTIGLLYNPDKTGLLAEKTKAAARQLGLQLVAEEVYNSRNVPSFIQEMKGKIDVFMMLPDVTVVTPETVEFMLLFSLENKIPIVTFSEKYVEMGALMSIGIDAFDIGAQAGEIAEKILSGKRVMNGGQIEARKAVISINLKAAKKLGIAIDEKVIGKAVIIN